MLRGVSLVLVTAMVWVGFARGATVLHVRSRLSISLDQVLRVQGGLVLSGTLSDPLAEQPVAGQTVALATESPGGRVERSAATGPDGRFRFEVAVGLGRHRLLLTAAGDRDHEAAPPIEQAIDLQRRNPRLRLDAPTQVPAEGGSLRLGVAASDPEARSAASPELPVELFVDGIRVGAVRTERGRAEAEVRIGAGRAGRRVILEARFSGDEQRNPTVARRVARASAQTTLRVALSPTVIRAGEQLTITGRLTHAQGGVSGARVGLVLGRPGLPGRELGFAFTDREGRFRAPLRLPGEPGAAWIEARAVPAQAFFAAARSSVLPLRIGPARALPAALYLAPPLCTALALAAVALWRRTRGRLSRWLGRLRVWASRRSGAPARPGARVRPLLGTQRSTQEAKPARTGGAAHLDQHRRNEVSAQVVDARSGRGLGEARVELQAPSGLKSPGCDEQGRFGLAALPSGRVELRLSAPGYLVSCVSFTLPHQGELWGVRIGLDPIRARILDAFDEAAEALLDPGELAACCTPRELVARVSRRRLLIDDVAALAELVEQACYSGRPPDHGILVEAERLAAGMRRVAPAPER